MRLPEATLLQRLFEQRHGLGEPARPAYTPSPGRSHQREKGREVGVLTERHAPFEHGDRLVEVPLAAGRAARCHISAMAIL